MLKPASLVVATVLGAATLTTSPTPEDTALPKRVRELEEWKAAADARIQALETRQKVESMPASAPSRAAPARVVAVVVSNKRFDPSDVHASKFEDNIWWDATYTATGLSKPARSIKGVLQFCDLFGDPRFQVRVTIDDPVKPNGTIAATGVGIQYNQFLDTHKWLRATELNNMTFKFEVETVLYEDGTSERFGK